MELPSTENLRLQCSLVSNVESKIHERLILLQQWKAVAQDYCWMHEECTQYFLLLNYCCVVPVIFLSTTTGAINLTNIHVCSGGTNIMGLILGIVGLSTAGLSALHNVLRYGERSIEHKESAKAFGMLARDISVEIILENTESKTYANMAEFIKECNEKFTLVTDKAPQIPDRIYQKLERYKKSDRIYNGYGDLSSIYIDLHK